MPLDARAVEAARSRDYADAEGRRKERRTFRWMLRLGAVGIVVTIYAAAQSFRSLPRTPAQVQPPAAQPSPPPPPPPLPVPVIAAPKAAPAPIISTKQVPAPVRARTKRGSAPPAAVNPPNQPQPQPGTGTTAPEPPPDDF